VSIITAMLKAIDATASFIILPEYPEVEFFEILVAMYQGRCNSVRLNYL